MSRALAALALVATAALAAPPLSPQQQAEDFDAMWRAIDARYAYFERGPDAWRRARAAWRPRAARAASRDEFVAALEGALAQLRDDHARLSEESAAAPPRVPYDSDIHAQWKNGAVVVDAVRTFSAADVAELRPGHVIARVDGVPVERAIGELVGRAPTPRERDWALQHALAGPRSGIQRLERREADRLVTLRIERGAAAANGPALLGRRMGEERDIGYLRVRVGAPDDRFAAHFDAALQSLKDTRGLILDLRENAAPGSREVTLAVLSRFVTAPAPWQVRKRRGHARVSDTVMPRGEPYSAPVVVLVDRWTAGEGEALAAGMVAVARARLIGTRTAGLRGELGSVRLPRSGIEVRFPDEKVFLPSGSPRETLVPSLLVDLAAPSGGPGDPILYQALKAFER